MTVLGKILVFLNLVASIVVAGLILVVYVARTNWAAGYEEYKTKYSVLTTRLQQTEKEKQDVRDELAKQINGLNAERTQLANALRDSQIKLQTAEQLLAQEKTKSAGENASVQVLQVDLERAKQEVKTLEDELKNKNKQVEDIVKLNRDLRDDKVKAEIERNTLRTRSDQLLTQLEVVTKENLALRRSGGTADTTTVVARDNPPPQDLEGLIKDTDPSGLVTVSIGSDAGLTAGHTLDVYRMYPDAQFLGTIRLTDVRATEAVGRVVGRPKSPVQKGDRVASNVVRKN